jgi:hypothetical protein
MITMDDRSGPGAREALNLSMEDAQHSLATI